MRRQIWVTPQHLPVLVTRHQGHLGNIEAGFEELDRCCVAQIIEVQVDDAEFRGRRVGRRRRPSAGCGERPLVQRCYEPLLAKRGNGITTGCIIAG